MTARLTFALLLIAALSEGAEPVDYVREVKPILQAHCVACHGPLKQEAGLRLDTAALALKGGESGSPIKPRDAAGSLLVQRISSAEEDQRMPPEGEPLTAEQIELLQRWVAEGAAGPPKEEVLDPRDHWAFKRPVRAPPPQVSSPQNNPIDAFIAAEHERLKLTPLPEADRSVLLRRVYLDLVGVPPSRAELQEFLSDTRPDAYEQVVERLLASPLHAQRWARHWMDIWRYSDWYGSRGGNELRNSRRHIWRWRDWIIESTAADKPYDRQIHEMLAGDELAPGDQNIGRATGYLGRSYYVFNRHVWLQDTAEYTSAGLLGLTLKCCRCHDHKYDPLAQEEYFRLRAFFEPLNVRTDQLPGMPEQITGNWPMGAPPGATLKDGFDVVFDADLAAPTYLLQRGNEKNPQTDKPLAPGIPAILGPSELAIELVQLPVEAFYPDLHPDRRQERLEKSQLAISDAQAALAKAQAAQEEARRKIQQLEEKVAAGAPPATAFLEDNFARNREDTWKPLSGEWQFADSRLMLTKPGTFSTIATLQNLPRDFKATLKYRTLPGGSIGSIGVFFDMVELKEAQGIYTHVNANSSGVQAFHRQGGQEHYPPAAIVNTPLKLEEEITLEFTARGQELTIWLNGELKLNYTMPVPRRHGKFALWGHAAVGEFLSLKIAPLEATVEDLKQLLPSLAHDEKLAQLQIELARAEAASTSARIEAELAKYASPAVDDGNKTELARSASKLERAAALHKAQIDVLAAERQLDLAKLAAKPELPKTQEAIQAAQTKLTAATTAAEQARLNSEKDDSVYQPLGPVYPATSSGRRLALAHWITSRDNPLTARVAVNHVWKRHFGTALVSSVANFGLNGKPPSHPELLDYLAVEFMESGWSLHHLHRLIVTSAAYKRASSHADATQLAHNRQIDAGNKNLWRANLRRMESEVVRDSLLALTGGLDCSHGGPELDPSLADSSSRRSLYFRITPDDQAPLLELFDGAAPAECFERTESIVPQQALALANGPVAAMQSRLVARELDQQHQSPAEFIQAAFEQVLSRQPAAEELASCERFLERQTKVLADTTKLTRRPAGINSAVAAAADPRLRARENLVHVLINHQDFITVR